MANEKNLIPQNQRTKNEQREIARKGGLKSGKVRAERKLLKEELKTLLNEENCQKKICLSLINKAIKGNTKAFEVIRDTIGENYKEVKSTEAVSTSVTIIDDMSPFSELTVDELKILESKIQKETE